MIALMAIVMLIGVVVNNAIFHKAKKGAKKIKTKMNKHATA